MDSQPTLQQLVAGLLRVDPGQIENSTSLEPLAGSLNRAKLSFALQRVGKTLPDHWFPGSFGELAGFVSGAEAVEMPIAAPAFTLPSLAAGTMVGLDVETVASLPEATDYWEHDFYRKVFTRAELAYCLMADMPRTHLAGFWCAKEALRKCGDHLLRLELNSIQVSHNEAGRPLLQILEGGEWQATPAALSISHTDTLAMAVVVMHLAPAVAPVPLPPPAPVPVSVEPVMPVAGPQRTGSPALLLALALIGLIALVALLRTCSRV